mmetsp:Transcript_4253/g.12421  ORF Transcript_4253/g.12421 Transcript_4253/m.12421 type:complete len:214 (+) Transcript_4253:955-1596(+)
MMDLLGGTGTHSPGGPPSIRLLGGAVASLFSVRGRLCQGVSGAFLDARLRLLGEAPPVSVDAVGEASPCSWTAELGVAEPNFSSWSVPAWRSRAAGSVPLSERGAGAGPLADSLGTAGEDLADDAIEEDLSQVICRSSGRAGASSCPSAGGGATACSRGSVEESTDCPWPCLLEARRCACPAPAESSFGRWLTTMPGACAPSSCSRRLSARTL